VRELEVGRRNGNDGSDGNYVFADGGIIGKRARMDEMDGEASDHGFHRGKPSGERGARTLPQPQNIQWFYDNCRVNCFLIAGLQSSCRLMA
jgi:hypothetical protein